ncbi:MAG: S8 family serine peptidase [Pseudomonadota bacterium]
MANTESQASEDNGGLRYGAPVPTGGYVVTVKETVSDSYDYVASAIQKLTSEFNVNKMAADSEIGDSGLVSVDDFKLAYVEGQASEMVQAVANSLRAEDEIEDVRPEFYLFGDDAAAQPQFSDTAVSTWGVEAVGANLSAATGSGVKLAVLDTGFDFQHPDFASRTIVKQSFVPRESADDVQGHGTHCAGTAAGPQAFGAVHPRYGVAFEADLYIGKVLNNSGAGAERWITSGMSWAIQQGCDVISMSLGRATQPGEGPTPEYERAGQIALANNCLIIAAAGNESDRRYGYIAPVGAPANSPSIMAIAALDRELEVANFSCGGINPNGGEIDLAAPGVDVFSSVPLPRRYQRLSGTSMACPHVAGVAALWAQTNPALRGTALWNQLINSAMPLSHPARDCGAGLVKAP